MGCGASLEQDNLAQQCESGSAVELSFDLLDAVYGALDTAGAPLKGESGCHGVEVSEQVECEAGEAGQLAGINGLDPDGERGAEAVAEYLAEVAYVVEAAVSSSGQRAKTSFRLARSSSSRAVG